jgi:hypothetical protein
MRKLLLTVEVLALTECNSLPHGRQPAARAGGLIKDSPPRSRHRPPVGM